MTRRSLPIAPTRPSPYPRTKRGIDAFGGNMPFLGGRRIATQYGERCAEWLTEMYGGTGDTDYVGYFFHRASELMTPSASLGFIATNAIADGDNRRTVLGRLLSRESPFHLHAATTGMPWPGNAQVLVSTLFLERGLPEQVTRPRLLDGRTVTAINSRLRAGNEWPEPEALADNSGLALVGCFLRGEGFVLAPEEAERLLRDHPEESAVIRPFLVGDDLNNTPDQQARRFVIDFGDMTLDQARAFPHALAIVEARVRPVRERLKTSGADADHRKYWWRFANVRRELREQAARVPRLLATARVSKHPCFAFFPSTWTPSEQVVVFPLPSWTAFAVLQSRVHHVWISLQATHMGEGIRYSAGDCFVPFPFPAPSPSALVPPLEAAGERLYLARAAFMQQHALGLTQTYNLLTSSSASAPGLDQLRALHAALDRAVLDAYGWTQIPVPRYADPAGEQGFEDAVAGRLFNLNADRARAAPMRPGLRRAKAATGPGPRKVRSSEPAQRRKSVGRPR